MKMIIVILLFFSALFSQWENWNEFESWQGNGMPKPVAEWNWKYNVTKTDTGTTIVNSLVSDWWTTNNLYDAVQSITSKMPLYDNLNGGIKFDYTDDYLNAGNIPNPGNNNFTWVAWIYPGSPNAGHLINKEGTARYSIRITPSGSLIYIFVYLFDDDGTLLLDGAVGVKYTYDSQYHFIVIVYDMQNNTVKGYLDGNLNQTLSIPNHSGINPTGDLFIGAYSATWSFYNGYISYLAYYKRALTPAQIKRLYNKGRPQ